MSSLREAAVFGLFLGATAMTLIGSVSMLWHWASDQSVWSDIIPVGIGALWYTQAVILDLWGS